MKGIPLDHFIFGALTVELRGDGVSDVLGGLQREGIRLTGVRMRSGKCMLTISLRDFSQLYGSCRQHHAKIRFLERSGFPFLVRKVKRRKVFVLSFGLFIALLYAMSAMIWQVTVSGVGDDEIAAIRQAARDSGLYVGAWRHSISNVEQLQQQLLQKLPSLAWIGVNIEGSKASIEAVEKVPGIQTKDLPPRNVIARKTGVLRRVFANRGAVIAVPGQVVHPGQIIISGDLGPGAKQVPAAGRVLAEVWYSSKVELPLRLTHAELTGESVQRQYLTLGGVDVRVWGWEQPDYPASVDRTEESSWHLGRWLLPFQLKTVTVYEVSMHTLAQSEAATEVRALEITQQDVRSQMGTDGTILGQTVLQRHISHGKLYATVLTRTEEDIGAVAPIPKPEPIPPKQTSR